MPGMLSVQVVGVQSTLDALDKLGDRASKLVDEVASQAADNIVREAAQRVRRRTGRTARAITKERANDGNGFVVFVDTPEDTWPNLDIGLEFGTIHMTAAPFLHVSALLESEAFQRALEQALEDALSEVSA